MRKTMLCILFLIGCSQLNFAQIRDYYYYGAPYSNWPVNNADKRFNFPQPGRARVNFHFRGLNNSTAITLELLNIKQLTQLPNLDSILSIVKANLKFLSDSLKEDAVVRRVDYQTHTEAGAAGDQVRIVNFDTRPKQFVINKGELNELKIDQDTLRIMSYALIQNISVEEEAIKIKTTNRDGYSYSPRQPFYITLLLNNINDIYKLDNDVLARCMTLLKKEVTDTYVAEAKPLGQYTAYFDVKNEKLVSPSKVKWIKYMAGYAAELVPNIYAGIGYVRGSLLPSMSAGLRYTLPGQAYGVKRFYAMWEPHFFFTRDAGNKLITDRNDFITLRYIYTPKRRNEGFDFVDNFSIGYLVRRSGNWFEPGTWKIGLPAVRSGWLQLEPELFFNGFFKNFSPSLRLTLHYE